MWEWLDETLKEMIGMFSIDPTIGQPEDVMQETLMYLYENQNLARKIYDTQSRSLMYSTMCKVMYKEKAKAYGINRGVLASYNRIAEVCERYGIESEPDNAYKISLLIDDPKFSIVYVKGILEENIRDVFDSRKMQREFSSLEERNQYCSDSHRGHRSEDFADE